MRFLLLSLVIHFSSIASAQPNSPVTKIAFGSCSRQSDTLQLWNEVLKFNPDIWIWGGDNVYGDTKDMKLLKAKYEEQKSRPSYQKLRESSFITGTWDDHDYGKNDAGKSFSKKKESKKLLLDFLDVPQDDHVWSRPGVYSSYTFGAGKQQIKIINLDTRWFRDNLKRNQFVAKPKRLETPRYKINKRGDVLGKKQWCWLVNELSSAGEQLILINSSIQVITDEHRLEKWGNFPTARQKLLDVITRTGKNVIILSGDQHIAEISRLEIPGITFPIYDITSSGLTHAKMNGREIANRYRVNNLIIEKNFGLLEIDWSGNHPKVLVSIRGHHNQLFLSHLISFDPDDQPSASPVLPQVE
jgi:alkaline phosphatase D